MINTPNRKLWTSAKPYLGLLTCVLLGVASGCSREKNYVEAPIYPTSGKLLVDGEPAEGAFIMFHPVDEVGLTKGNKPFARVGKDGYFSLTTYDTHDGAPAGEYEVSIRWPENPNARGPSPDRLEGRYATPEKSKLSVTIEPPKTILPPWDLK